MTFTIEIPDDQWRTLSSRALAQGISEEHYVRLILSHDLSVSPATRRRHISDVIRENMLAVPRDVLTAFPADLSVDDTDSTRFRECVS